MSGPDVFLILVGLVAGAIDAIAGGGGLIALPAMSLVVGPGVEAIGTNKIASLGAAGVAFLVYLWRGHVDWKSSVLFTVAVGIGALGGSIAGQWVPTEFFPWMLAVTCPMILYIVWKREWLTERIKPAAVRDNADMSRHVSSPDPPSQWGIAGAGVLAGLYDGIWGPGGGTLMFLGLLFFARLPLLTALAASKLANSAAAIVALVTYGVAGHVHVHHGVMLASGMMVGGFFGANLASTSAARVVRPTLLIIVVLLAARVIAEYS